MSHHKSDYERKKNKNVNYVIKLYFFFGMVGSKFSCNKRLEKKKEQTRRKYTILRIKEKTK